MQTALVQAQTETGKAYFVLKTYLPRLIKERTIQRFRPTNRWLDIKEDRRRTQGNGYSGRERRLTSMVDWTSFPLSIEEQLQKGHSVEAVLGFGGMAQEIGLKLKNVAKTNLSVLIQGKTGTGKGLAASILHQLSKRKTKPFIRVDCGAIPPTLIESELFGYEKGSFTGAFRSKPGRFQLADGGTIFLDEIANLSLEMQTRLLGFLEERVVNSIGGVKSVKIDVRIISATNADLVEQIRKYQFREDLFYRLNEFEISIPSLKERLDDLFYLAAKFLVMANVELQKNVLGFSEEAVDFLSTYEWSGNVRELKNVIKRAALSADQVIEIGDLLGNVRERQPSLSLDSCLENAFAKGRSLHEITDMITQIVERRVIERVYENSNNNKVKTSQSLGIDYSTLYRKMVQYTKDQPVAKERNR